jgi:hypothetical protein
VNKIVSVALLIEAYTIHWPMKVALQRTAVMFAAITAGSRVAEVILINSVNSGVKSGI